MQLYLLMSAVALLLSAGASAATISGKEQDVLSVQVGDSIVMLLNDLPVRFRLAPDAVSVPTVNADVVAKVGLKPSMIGYVYVIGSVRIPFKTDDVRYKINHTTFKSRTAFSDKQVVKDADGIAGPGSFPFQRITFNLREPRADDRAIAFPLDKKMGRSQTGVKIEVGGKPVYVAFSFDRAESLVTATGGRWIADANGGRFDGDVRNVPILYGISRPIRSLSLDRSLMLGELIVRNIAVRVSDEGNVSGILNSAAMEQDPNEIVVTGESKRKVPNQRLVLGMDTIGHCASIIYDFNAGMVTLMCPDQPQI